VSYGIDTVSGTVTRAVRRAAALALLVGVTTWSNATAQGPVLQSELTSETLVAPEQQAEATFCCQKKHFWLAAGEFLALEIIPNYFNRFVADDTTAVLSWTSFRRNVQRGFEWDPNNLATNMFAHPYHGNVYFNAGRSNGYNFWESQAWAFAGSFVWEMFGENNRGAINDWAMTSLGGITIGEALHRAATMVRDNEARGVSRAFSEFGGFLIDPVGGFSRAIRGEWSKHGPNPENRFPDSYGSAIRIGFRAVAEGRLANAEKATGFFEFQANYGDPMEPIDDPFDAFMRGVAAQSLAVVGQVLAADPGAAQRDGDGGGELRVRRFHRSELRLRPRTRPPGNRGRERLGTGRTPGIPRLRHAHDERGKGQSGGALHLRPPGIPVLALPGPQRGLLAAPAG
jgi:hypothetical protein